jgi:hypothetical protein
MSMSMIDGPEQHPYYSIHMMISQPDCYVCAEFNHPNPKSLLYCPVGYSVHIYSRYIKIPRF